MYIVYIICIILYMYIYTHDDGGGTHLHGLHNNILFVRPRGCTSIYKVLWGEERGTGGRTWDVAERDSRPQSYIQCVP